MSQKNTEKVKVAVRCRPLSSDEKVSNRQVVVLMDLGRGEITVKNPKADSAEPPKTFTFDLVYDSTSSQEQIYSDSAYGIVDGVLEGYNGTIFAYGQTGTGKTFTMEGPWTDKAARGIMPRSFEHIFTSIQAIPHRQFLVRASYLEIYNEEIRDLLSKNPTNKLDLRENPDKGFYVKDLSSFMIQSAEEMMEKLETGKKNRVVGSTDMNAGSSRSHSIFIIYVEMSDLDQKTGENKIRAGKLNLVDLAGSERVSKTNAQGERFKEGININQSLTALGNVISALVDPKAGHIPYRDSKLTKLLMDSLGGNTKTLMISNIGPADYNYDETLSTLRYANRAKNIKNKPKINEDPKDAMLRQFQEEIQRLREQLSAKIGGGQIPSGPGGGQQEVVVADKEEEEKRIKEMEEKLAKEKEDLEKQMENERKKIEQHVTMAEEEKIKLLQKLREKEEQQKSEMENQEKLIKKLKKMEDKLLQGKEAMQLALAKEKEIQKAKRELEERKEREQRMAEELLQKTESELMYVKKFSNIKEQIEDTTNKLKVVYDKFQQSQSELEDIQEEHAREREILSTELREYIIQLKLKNMIIDHFIPQDEVERIMSLAVYNEELDTFYVHNSEICGNSLRENIDGKSNNLNNFYDDNEELKKLNQDIHSKIYYVYTEEGPIREDQLSPKEKKARLKTAAKKTVNKTSAKQSDESYDSFKKTDVSKTSTATEQNFPKAKGLVTKKIKNYD